MIIARQLARNTTSMTMRSASQFSRETVLSEANQKRCIEAMKKGPKISFPKDDQKPKEAAVLIPICLDKDNRLSLLYTVRSSNLKRHVGEVSFPGGVRDETDKDFIECALRETEEEIGIPREKVKVWGVGQPILPYSRFLIYPVVGVVENFENLLPLKLNEDEVADYFLVPLDHLCDTENQQYTHFRAGYTIPAFINAKAKIWGITAVLTDMALKALLPSDVYSFSMPQLKKLKL